MRKEGVSIFGYLKPYNNELKVKYVNEYKLAYCTLCHGLRTNLGFWSSTLLNYECAFLYIFLTALYPEESTEKVKFRCPMNPAKKQTTFTYRDALQYVSFVNYHLALLKVLDGCTDSKFFKKLGYRILFWVMSRNKKYASIKKKFSTMAEKTDNLCKELYQLEKECCNDYDSCSMTMGYLLMEIVDAYIQRHPAGDSETILSFAKHIGMWTYLIDAYDDFEKDQKKERFNPLRSFAAMDNLGEPTSVCLKSGEVMLGMMAANLSALQKNITVYRYFEIIENIINYGTRSAVQTIKNKRKKK